MKDVFVPFIPAPPVRSQYPINRFLPPFPHGTFGSWLRSRYGRGEWLLDPLGSTPLLAIEAASEGYRVLVTSNNPILTFMLETLATAPQASELKSSLAELAHIRSGNDRLELHLRSLYLTGCPTCNTQIEVDAFLWRKGDAQPYGKLITCKYCGTQNEFPVTSQDLVKIQQIGKDSLHRSRAMLVFEKGDDRIRDAANEALENYLPRSLYFIFTLINKITTAPINETHRRYLIALLLNVLDEGNTLWAYPAARSRPRQLFTPPQFRENNLWHALESSIPSWTFLQQKIPISHYPDLPPGTGGICIFPGRLRALFSTQQTLPIKAGIMVIPRPNQAFWTLSAIWSAWLWGAEASVNLASSLERRRYDWPWFAGAMYSILGTIVKNCDPLVDVFAVAPEIENGFLTSILTGFRGANFRLKGFAQRQEIVQLHWTKETLITAQPIKELDRSDIKEGIREFLSQRNEPAPYSQIFTNSLAQLSVSDLGLLEKGAFEKNIIKEITNQIDSIFSSQGFLRRYEQQSENLESGYWWLANELSTQEMTLSDRVEKKILVFLKNTPKATLAEIDRMLCLEFPGLLTPSIELIMTILESYAEAIPGLPKRWQMLPQENSEFRKQDIALARSQLTQIAKRIGYGVSGDQPLSWFDQDGKTQMHFYLIASSMISRFILQEQDLPERNCTIVLPGSRASLLTYKLKRDPRLAEKVSQGWHFLKFRHLNRINDYPDLSVPFWWQILDGDPPREDETQQISIF